MAMFSHGAKLPFFDGGLSFYVVVSLYIVEVNERKGRREQMDADFLLIQKIKNGDEYAINTFVHKYYATILKYCHVHIRDYGFAEDLTQETFVSFFRTVHKYQHYGKALNYMYIIAGNKCKVLLLWFLLKYTDSNYYTQRCIGIAAPLFVIMLVPEIWKNRNANAMEIECTSYYSLRQMYAARMMLLLLGYSCWIAVNIPHMNEQGEIEYGPAAVRQLRAQQKEWAGPLTIEKIQQVIAENQRIMQTSQAQSKDYKENNIAYSWKQGVIEIRDLLCDSFAEDFRSYDYYRVDSLTPEDADAFYDNRTRLLKEWLASEDANANALSDKEKDYLIQQYEAMETPINYDYMKGWTRLFEYEPTVIMITLLILGYIVAGIFSEEFQWKTDVIFFSTVYGRDKAVAAKIKAGYAIVTVLYWLIILLYSGFVLLYLGGDGAFCPVQADSSGWKCFYNLQIWQKYLLTVGGGYIGCLFVSSLTMLVSSKAKSAVLAVMIPFILIFIPSFLSNIEGTAINKVLGLLPDRLLQVSMALGHFDLYEIGGKIMGAVPILLMLYGILTLLLIPVIYQDYRHKQIG